MVTVAPRRVGAGLARRWGRWAQRVREAVPHRPPAWRDTAAARADAPDELLVETVGALRRHLLRDPDAHRARRLRVTVTHWRAPYPGWSGRLGPLPGLLRHELSLPAGGAGPASVAVELAEPVPMATMVAAVLAVLTSVRPFPTTAGAATGLTGPPPGWLPPGAVTPVPEPAGSAGSPGSAGSAGSAGSPGLATVPACDVTIDTRPGSAGTAVGPNVLPGGPAGISTPPAVLVDSATANPVGRRRYDSRLPGGRLVLAADGGIVRWRIDGDPGLLVAGVAGEPLDERQSAALAGLADIGCAARDDGVPAAAYAAVVAQVAMTGVLVHAGTIDRPVAELLGGELSALLAAGSPARPADPLARQLASVRQRRAALRQHATALALPRVAGGGYPGPARPPAVTALLLTRRPGRLATVLADLAAQTYPELEILIGLHGVAVPPDVAGLAHEADRAGARPVRTVEIPASTCFGAALGELTRLATGSLLTKVDDDDRYGPEHVWDLVLARLYSAATVVGKAAEFVHLEASGVTVHRPMSSEHHTDVVAGGALLVGRGDLEAVGGWRPVARSVDRALLDRVLAAGGLVYRTHGFGYLYTRHGDGHTWDPGTDYFTRGARRRWSGFPPYPEFPPHPESPVS